MDLGAPSVASTSISQQTPITAGSATSDIKPVPIPKQELRTLLGINEALADSQSKSLHLAFTKYTACLAAVQLYERTVAEGKWPTKYEKVTVTEIRQLFVSKSVWHAQYVPCFQDITKYGEMLAWLESTPQEDSGGEDDIVVDGAVDDEALWGKKKAIYHFVDLKEWLEKKKKETQKGKAKAKKVAKKTAETKDKEVTKKKK